MNIISLICAVASTIVAVVTGYINWRTLREMEAERIESVSPLLEPELDDEHSMHIRDLEIEIDCPAILEDGISFHPSREMQFNFFIKLPNYGKGPACNIVIYKINDYLIPQNKKFIRIIKPDEFKRIGFFITIGPGNIPKEKNNIDIIYENVFGQKYEQRFDFEVVESLYSYNVKNILFNPAKKVKKMRSNRHVI